MEFTFHNVSINSKLKNNRFAVIVVFTFHNVSINSLCATYHWSWLLNLHSIMYLLIRRENNE